MAATKAAGEGLKQRVRLVVWDFDLTIMHIHAYGSRVTVSDVTSGARVLADDFEDLPMFTALVRHLVDAGFLVAVASFGSYPVIQAYMDAAFGKGQVGWGPCSFLPMPAC